MDRSLLLRNRAVARIVVGTPQGHQHLRARIESAAGDVITLQEATLAALARAYIDIKTHPHRQAVELCSQVVDQQKPGFAEHQLLEVESDPSALCVELARAPSRSEAPSASAERRDEDLATQLLPELDTSSGRLKPLGEQDASTVFGDTPTVASRPGSGTRTKPSDS